MNHQYSTVLRVNGRTGSAWCGFFISKLPGHEVFQKCLELSKTFKVFKMFASRGIIRLSEYSNFIPTLTANFFEMQFRSFFWGCNDLPFNAKTGFKLWKKSKRKQNCQSVHFEASRTGLRFKIVCQQDLHCGTSSSILYLH